MDKDVVSVLVVGIVGIVAIFGILYTAQAPAAPATVQRQEQQTPETLTKTVTFDDPEMIEFFEDIQGQDTLTPEQQTQLNAYLDQAFTKAFPEEQNIAGMAYCPNPPCEGDRGSTGRSRSAVRRNHDWGRTSRAGSYRNRINAPSTGSSNNNGFVDRVANTVRDAQTFSALGNTCEYSVDPFSQKASLKCSRQE